VNPPVSPAVAPAPLVPSAAEPPIPAAQIDASCRGPLLFLFISGMIWLVFGLLLTVISSIKLHVPGFLAGADWLTFGRVRPAAMNATLYGFASQTAMGVLLWMLCRLGRTRLLFHTTLVIAIAFWNLGVTLGVLGIFAGGSTGFEWLEMPRYASPILFGAYVLIGFCALTVFYTRRERSLYVSQWYLLAALFWFPWIYSAANLLLVFYPVRGVVQSIVDAWFANNFVTLWLGPIGLAAIFYFIPKLTGRPLYNRSLAAFGFWTLAFFGNWTGPVKLVGGPVPAWMVSTGIAANALLLIPLICCAMNWHLTLRGLYKNVKEDITLRFIVVAAAAYLLSTLRSIPLGLREISRLTHLTFAEAAQTQLVLLGFISMALFGSMHYIVPRMLQMEWPSAKRGRFHFWSSAVGIAIVFLSLSVGGIIQGTGLNNPALPFINVVRSTIPFIGLATLGQLLILAGQVALLWNLIVLAHRQAEPFRKAVMGLALEGRSNRGEAPA